MKPLKVLANFGLLDWSSILLGFRNGWIERSDIYQYAFDLLQKGCDDKDVSIIAESEDLNDYELERIISNKTGGTDESIDMDRWRLAFLMCLDDNKSSEEEKICKLQEIYADFGYPEDMSSCSIYSCDGVAPLVAMNSVVEKLKSALL